ncbi:MAG: diphthine--ammonia ligase [Deltaproteobacteria bacterium]|nr:diphthine--ammonia ligase [Deltaproteobacteria bacterium]
MKSLGGSLFFSSWSGGKDSCLALYHAIQHDGIPKALLTLMTEGKERSRSHGLPIAVFKSQASSLGIPLVPRSSSWADYEHTFISAAHEFRKEGVEYGVFGDIDVEPHLEWVKRVCASASIQAYEPLWKRDRSELLDEFFSLGFKAMIIAVKQETLDNDFLGRILDRQVINEMKKVGIDASGENGEYHTVVIDGPIFAYPLQLEKGRRVIMDGYGFLDVSVR